MEKHRSNLMICAGTGCIATGTHQVRDALEAEIKKHKLTDEVKVVLTGCNGFCAEGPVMMVFPEDIFYQKITVEEVPKLVEEHFLKGRPYEKLMFKEPLKKSVIPIMHDIPFFKYQVLRVLRNKGLIDPESLDEYIARDGYQAAAKALTEMTPEQIIKTVKDAGLRGRGGAGFPSGLKWEFASKTEADKKFMLCNGDEGDPGAFMDRAVMEADPHSVIEGMIIGAKAIGSNHGVIYVRAEYPLAVERLQMAIDKCMEIGLLGKNIFDSGFDFELEIYLGAGAFVCGEETALMRSIEGKRGMPRPRPPFPAHKGLWDKPSVLNNVETLAQVAPIILNGSEWYRSVGTEQSAGTKVFALTGDIKNVGLVEVPMGTPLKTIIYDIGGGMTNKKKKFKAVQMGGPSGGCIPEAMLDVPVTYEDIIKTGAIMGSGGMVVMDEDTCMVSTSKFFLEFTAEESCGKCTPCRVGTQVMLDLLTDITEGRGKEGDIETLEDLSHDIIATSLCGLGQTAPNPVLSTIRYFRQEYESHINNHYCQSGICGDLCSFEITDACKGCQACVRACPKDAIVGEKKQLHRIMQDLCIQCRSCYNACKFQAVDIKPALKKDKQAPAVKDEEVTQ
ncbi:MAG: NADH-quinone oxidoreductase subunit NuoF [Nitrospira sp.]|nr:NADH-quinone oxidoreductase subunit NuoF [bacterium]MBL7047914.1 NADH-quinone oxidoreductase subunit NuoF [Nitrospira sp.]